MTVDLLHVLLRLFGIIPPCEGAFKIIHRALVIAACSISCVHGVLHLACRMVSTVDYIIHIPYAYDAFHTIFVYLWCCSALRTARPLSNGVIRWANYHLTIHIVLSTLMVIVNIELSMNEDFVDKDSLFWRWLNLASRFIGYCLTIRSVLPIVYTWIAVQMHQIAWEIKELPAELGFVRPAEICHRTVRLCSEGSAKMSSILLLIYVEYFMHMLTAIPADIPIVGVRSYIVLHVGKQMYTFLLIVSGGDAVLRSTLSVRRSMRRLVNNQSNALNLYLREEHGIAFATTLVSWRNCCAFVGLTSTFSVMVFEVLMSDARRRGAT